jgi:hypothetical protein
MAATYGSFRDFEGYLLEEIREFDEDDQVQIITEWFAHQFEDPQNDTPYNKEMGGYVYPWGGPFDASEQIHDEFSNVIDFDIMMRAVEEVQASGVLEWAPQTNGDFYEHPEDDRDAEGVEYGDAVEGGEPIVMADLLRETEARQALSRRVEKLETLIQPLLVRLQEQQQPPAMMGHNNPPEHLDNFHGVSRDDWLQLRDAIAEIKEQIDLDTPDVDTLNQRRTLLQNAAATISKLIVAKLDVAVNAVIGAGAVGGVAYIYTNPEVVAAELTSVAEAVGTWINSLPIQF